MLFSYEGFLHMEDITEEVTQVKETVHSLNSGVIKSWLASLIPDALSVALCVVLALVVYAVGVKVIKLVRRMNERFMTRREVDVGVRQFVDQIIKVIGYLILIVVILQLFGIQTSSVAAVVASLGLTAGLALQGSLSNFAGGVLILVLRPFSVGDYIVEHTHGNEGTVSEITIFYTKLKTIDNRVVVIPNGTLANSSMTNVTGEPYRNLDLVAPISYGDDIRLAKEVLKRVIEEEPARIKDREVLVFVKELGESSIDLGLRFWIPTERYWEVCWRTIEKIKYAFDEAGITIPFHSLQVYLPESGDGKEGQKETEATT